MKKSGSGNLLSPTAFGTIMVLAIASFLIDIMPTEAQSCQPLKYIGGSGTKVQKTVSPPGTQAKPNNWNTDFIVPSNQKYERYVVTLIANNSGEYEVEMSLNYNDKTSEQFYQAKPLQLDQGESITITAQPKNNATPDRVKLEIGGVTAVGRNYTISVAGCNQ
jgi:hypothetical protein